MFDPKTILKTGFAMARPMLLCLVLAKISIAAPVLDQSFDAVASGANSGSVIQQSIIQDFDTGQTFTAGLTGLLTRVDVQASLNSNFPEDLLVQIRPVVTIPPPTQTANQPDPDNSSFLASVAVPGSAVNPSLNDLLNNPFWVSVDLTSFNIFVTAGDILSIVLRVEGAIPTNYFWAKSATDLYSGGRHFQRSDDGPNWGPFDFQAEDHGFRTFVDTAIQAPNPAPEPASVALFSAGLGLLAAFRLRRRNRTAASAA